MGRALNKLEGMKTLIEAEHGSILSKVEALRSDLSLEEEVALILEQIASLGSNRVSMLIGAGLQVIYGAGYEFKREAKSIVVSENEVDAELLTAHGGGLVDVVSVLLRIIALRQKKGGAMMTLILDEPFHNADHETAIKAGHFLKSLCERMGFNILIVTHRPELTEPADVVYEVSKGINGTEVKRKE